MEFFSQLSIVLDIVIFLIMVFITYMSHRLYSTFRKPRYLQFSTGFLFITIGYLFIAIINILTYPSISTAGAEELPFAGILTNLWYVPVLIGLFILTCLYYEIADRKVQFLIASLLAAGFLLGGTNKFSFIVFSGLLFFFIALKLYQHYRANPDRGGLFILIGFSLLFLAKVVSGLLFVHDGLYIGYYFFKLTGAALIARSLWVIAQ